MSATETKTLTYIVDVHSGGRPFMRVYAEGATPEGALAQARGNLDGDEEAVAAEPLQVLLDGIRDKVAAGGEFHVAFKHEDDGPSGPVWIVDAGAAAEDASARVGPDGSRVFVVPFGETPEWETRLPWMRRAEAKRLAKYLGVPYEES